MMNFKSIITSEFVFNKSFDELDQQCGRWFENLLYDSDLKGMSKYNILHYSIYNYFRSKKSSKENIRKYLERGGRIDIKTGEGQYPLDLAISHNLPWGLTKLFYDESFVKRERGEKTLLHYINKRTPKEVFDKIIVPEHLSWYFKDKLPIDVALFSEINVDIILRLIPNTPFKLNDESVFKLLSESKYYELIGRFYSEEWRYRYNLHERLIIIGKAIDYDILDLIFDQNNIYLMNGYQIYFQAAFENFALNYVEYFFKRYDDQKLLQYFGKDRRDYLIESFKRYGREWEFLNIRIFYTKVLELFCQIPIDGRLFFLTNKFDWYYYLQNKLYNWNLFIDLKPLDKRQKNYLFIERSITRESENHFKYDSKIRKTLKSEAINIMKKKLLEKLLEDSLIDSIINIIIEYSH